MDDKYLTADERQEFAEAFEHDATSCSAVEKREKFLKLAEACRTLSIAKKMVPGQVN